MLLLTQDGAVRVEGPRTEILLVPDLLILPVLLVPILIARKAVRNV
jgi:hypothetical protein